MEFSTKYYGKLKNFDFTNINKDNFNILIASEVFNEFDSTRSMDDYKEVAIEFGGYNSFSNYFVFNGKEYWLKKEVYTEMIYVKNWFLESFNEIDFLTDEIEVLIVSEFQLENKLKLLEENFKNSFKQIRDKRYYSLFKNETSTNGYENWEEYLIDEIDGKEEYESVENFLKGVSKFLNKNIEGQWNDYFVFSKISDYCEKKKHELLNFKKIDLKENNENDPKKIDLSFQLALIEEVMRIDNWEDVPNKKKGNILALLLGKSNENIRKYYDELNRKSADSKGKFYDKEGKYHKDKLKAEESIRKLLG